MNRRDTIITAVLINAGLLVVLFASALKTDPKVVAKAEPPKKVEIEMPRQVLKKQEPKVEPVIVKKEPVKAPEPKKVAPTPKPKMELVVVQSGDALEKIARRHGTSVDAIVAANDLMTHKLKIGQELQVPVGKKVKAPVKPSPKFYTIRAGDSPWTIASKNKIKLGELLSLNDLDEASAKKLKPGDKLRIE